MTQADLNYFSRFPHRRYRVRVAGRAEIEQAELLGIDMTLRPGDQRYRAIRYLTPDACLALPIIGPADADPELFNETVARALFEKCAPTERPHKIFLQGVTTVEQMLAMLEVLK